MMRKKNLILKVFEKKRKLCEKALSVSDFTPKDYLAAWWGPVRCCAFLCGPVRSCVVLCGPVRCLVGLRRCHTWNKFRLIASKWMQEMMQELCAKSLASFLDVSTGHCQYSFAQTFLIFDFKLSYYNFWDFIMLD